MIHEKALSGAFSCDKTILVTDGEKMKRDIRELEKIIQYRFKKIKLLEQAMMHRSYINEMHLEKSKSNERLEFLGDAVLELVTSEFLYTNEKEKQEGQLTKTRASFVCESTLAACAKDIQLGSFLRLGKGEDANGGRERKSLVSDAFEALIGAIYIDGGFAIAKEFIHNFVLKDIQGKVIFNDSKTILQEKVQGGNGGVIEYRLVHEEGPDHQKKFVVEVYVNNQVMGSGEGQSKKAAEQKAALNAMEKITQES